MENKKATVFLKQMLSTLCSAVKAKGAAVRNRTRAGKVRLVMVSLMNNKKLLMDNLSQKIHGLLGQHDDDLSKAIIVYDDGNEASNSHLLVEDIQLDDDSTYADLTHSLVDQEELNSYDEGEGVGEGEGGSIIDMVKNSMEEGGEEFRLEDEIDHVADLFITKFHRQIRMQKLLSFKRFQQMLERSV